MKKCTLFIFAVLALALFSVTGASAQTTVLIGAGSSALWPSIALSAVSGKIDAIVYSAVTLCLDNMPITSVQTAAPFAAATTCGAPVAPANDCTIQVTFTPTSDSVQTGTLTIADNAPGSPQTVALAGNSAGGGGTGTGGGGKPRSFTLTFKL